MRETAVLNEQTRAAAPGDFVSLSDGVVHYELSGPEDGHLVVLVHGALQPMFTFDALVPALRRAGFRVLRFDNYGRGWSDRPHARYDAELYVRQLRELLEALERTPPVHLLGLSQGGAIALAFTARYPERVDRLALLAPAGLPRRESLPERLATLPGLGELIVRLAGSTIIFKGLRHSVRSAGAVAQLRRKITVQMQFRGFQRSLLAMLRQFPMGGLGHAYETVGRQDRAVFLLWGTADGVLPYELSDLARELLPRAEFHPIEGGGHVVHWERPVEVNPLIVDFFTAHYRPGAISS